MSAEEKIAVMQHGGGFIGANIGVWKVLDRIGKRPKKVRGVSVGALNCAMYAQAGSAPLEKYWREVGHGKPSDIFSKMGIPWHLLSESLLSDYGLNQLTKKLDCQKIIDSDIELEVVVHNETKGILEIISSRDSRFKKDPEKLRKFIKASASLTGYFPAVEIDGELYSDGYYFRLEGLEDFDTIFVIVNDDPNPAPVPRIWYKRFRVGVRHVLDDMADLQMLYFLELNKEFRRFTKVESQLGFFKRLAEQVKNFPATVAAKVEEVLTGEPQFPKRLILVSPNYSIPTLTLDDFRPGDIDRAIDLSTKQAEDLLGRVYPETKAAN